MIANKNKKRPALRYEEIARHLRKEIEAGVLQPGDRLPPLRALRRQHGVTQATVERAYALLEGDNLIVRSHRSGIFVARPDERPATGIIGFCNVSFTKSNFSPYWTHVMEGVEAAAQEFETQILLLKPSVASGWDNVDGVLFNGLTGKTPASLLSPNLPAVSLFVPAVYTGSAKERQRALQQTGLITADVYAGMRAATKHLLSLGHRRITFLNNSRSDPILYPRRLAGYQDALREAGITPDERWLRALPVPSPMLYFMNAGREAMTQWLRDGWKRLGCTALLAHNDDTAWGAVEALRAAGIKVPEEVSVVGFDGIESAECCIPPLTTVEMPLQHMGQSSVEMLLRRMHGDAREAESIMLPTRLHVRDSTAPPA